MRPPDRKGKRATARRAVIIGAGMAALSAARALADHREHATLLGVA
jgi:hypothetical protein